MAVAGRVPHRGEALVSDDRRVSCSRTTRTIDDPGRPRYGGGVFDRHVTRWNDNCVFCHNVAPNPGRDPSTGDVQDHGRRAGDRLRGLPRPGRRARARQRRSGAPLRAAPRRPRPTRRSSIRRASRPRARPICAGAVTASGSPPTSVPFLAHGDPFVAGDDLARCSAPLWRDTPLRGDASAFAARFWDDGTPRLTAYEYQGLLQSACAQKGGSPAPAATACTRAIRAASSASASPGRTRDKMCTGCHAALAAPAALAQHTHHDPAGEGARCVGCHMPRIVYGVLDVHRSHRIDDPEAAARGCPRSRRARPDACTLCHVEGVPGGQAGVGATLRRSRGRARRARGRRRTRWDARRLASDERARRSARCSRSWRAIAIRHPYIAWRSLRRLVAPSTGPGTAGVGADFDPSADRAARRALVARLRHELGSAADRMESARAPAGARHRARHRRMNDPLAQARAARPSKRRGMAARVWRR